MAKFTALKQYLEKELQSKKFLEEGLDFVSQIESAESELKEVNKEIDARHSALADITKQCAAANDDLQKVKGAVNDATEEAKAVVVRAKQRAEELIAAADVAAKQLIVDTSKNLEAVRAETAALGEQKKKLTTEVTDLTKDKYEVSKDLEKIKKRFVS